MLHLPAFVLLVFACKMADSTQHKMSVECHFYSTSLSPVNCSSSEHLCCIPYIPSEPGEGLRLGKSELNTLLYITVFYTPDCGREAADETNTNKHRWKKERISKRKSNLSQWREKWKRKKKRNQNRIGGAFIFDFMERASVPICTR